MEEFLNNKYSDLATVAREYRNAAPFPSIFFRDFFDPDMLEEIRQEFPDLSESQSKRFDNALEK
jgi:hypothetical protein